jgi:hypothetical protein
MTRSLAQAARRRTNLVRTAAGSTSRREEAIATLRAVEIGGDRYRTVGGVHRIPIDGVSGMLVLAGLEAVGPDAAALLGHVGAETMVCLRPMPRSTGAIRRIWNGWPIPNPMRRSASRSRITSWHPTAR